MTHLITSLCLRDNGCISVSPVECINPGSEATQWPAYYIDPATCIDCGACVPECPSHAIYPEDEVPSATRSIAVDPVLIKSQDPLYILNRVNRSSLVAQNKGH